MLEYRRSLRDDEVIHIKNVVEKFLAKEQWRKESQGQSWMFYIGVVEIQVFVQ